MALRYMWLIVLAAALCWLAAPSPSVSQAPPVQVEFRAHTVDAMLGGDGSVMAIDINNDRRTDIVVNANGPGVTKIEYVWYENPTWERHVITDGKPATQEHTGYDIDGDGIPELVLQTGFAQEHERSEGNVWLLEHQSDPRGRWKERLIDHYPASHDTRFADIDGDGKKELINGPLTGPGTKSPWVGGKVSMFWYRPGEWKRMIITEDLNGINHRIRPVRWNPNDKREALLTSGYDGISLFQSTGSGNDLKWQHQVIHAAHPPVEGKPQIIGGGDAELGWINGKRFIASDEGFNPSDTVAVYLEDPPGKWTRKVLLQPPDFISGHDVAVADLNGDRRDDFIAGDRNGKDTHVFYAPNDLHGEWVHQVIPGMAAESNVIADINGDGRMDLVLIQENSKQGPKIAWFENMGKVSK
jgi:FG-GAP-like repeat